MLYSIIPPVIIVLSLIGIILLLMKKKKQIDQLPPEVVAEKLEDSFEGAGLTDKVRQTAGKIKGDDIKHFFLAILEQVTRRSRMIFLKLEARFAGWSNDIRNKRQARAEKKMAALSSREREDDIIKRLKEYRLSSKKAEQVEEIEAGESIETVTVEEEVVVEATPKKKRIFARKSQIIKSAGEVSLDEEEKEIKPIISEKIVSPRRRTEIKDRLEELLIERIAVNPKDIEAYERLGEYYLEIKSYTDAKECFKQVLKLNPADRNAKYRMRRLENLLAKQ